MLDLSEKIKQTATSVSHKAPKKSIDTQFERVLRDSNKIAGEEMTGLISGSVKAKLFNGVGQEAAKITPPVDKGKEVETSSAVAEAAAAVEAPTVEAAVSEVDPMISGME